MALGGPTPDPPAAKKEDVAISTPPDPKKLSGVAPEKEAPMSLSPAATDPAQAPAPQPSTDPTQQGPEANSYMQAHQQFSAAQPPDPNTFLTLIWSHLTSHQKDLIRALLSNPQAMSQAQEEQGEPAQSSGAAPVPSAPAGAPTPA